jgi:hypothetical protein
MTAPPVLTDDAEESTARLFRTLAAHKTAMLTISVPRRGRLTASSVDQSRIQERRQATLIRLVSIAESFASELLWREADADTAAPPGTIAASFFADAVIDSTSGWEAQERAYRKWFQVKLDWKNIGYLTDARNAAAHGLGQPTRRQLRTETSTIGRIKNANIAIVNQSIMLTEANLDDAVVWCRDFIEELDVRSEPCQDSLSPAPVVDSRCCFDPCVHLSQHLNGWSQAGSAAWLALYNPRSDASIWAPRPACAACAD